MGLDMYLEVAPRIEGMNFSEINKLMQLDRFISEYESGLELNKNFDTLYDKAYSRTFELYELERKANDIGKVLENKLDPNVEKDLRKKLDKATSDYQKAYKEKKYEDKKNLIKFLSSNKQKYTNAKEILKEKGHILREFQKEEPQELIYWRKANAIHNWFNQRGIGIENCEYYDVTKDVLVDLLEVIDEVLTDHSRAAELLPTQNGFFFGSTDYDEWYYQDLEITRKKMTSVLRQYDEESETLIYYAWW